MIRFISRILLISTFFIGLGAIGEEVLKNLRPTAEAFVFGQKPESEFKRIKLVRIESSSNEQCRFQMVLPKIAPEFNNSLPQNKLVILRETKNFE